MSLFLAWNKKEFAFMSTVKRGEDEKSPLLEQNNRLLVALFAAENLSKRAKDENQTGRDILKPVISKANVAKEAVARAVNSKLKDSLLDKEDELHFSLKEVERVTINKAVANDNDKKLKNLLFEVEVAMEEEKHISLSKQESTSKEVEVKVLTILNTEVETLDADDSHVKASVTEDVYSCYIMEFLGQIRTAKQETDLEHSLVREAGLVNRVKKFNKEVSSMGKQLNRLLNLVKRTNYKTEGDNNRKGYMRNVSCFRYLFYMTRPDLSLYVEVISRDTQRYKESCEATMKIRATFWIPIVGDSNVNHRVDPDNGKNVAGTEAARQAMWLWDLLGKIDFTVSEKVQNELSEVEHEETRELIGVE